MATETHPLGAGTFQQTLSWLRIAALKCTLSPTIKSGGVLFGLAPDDPLFILLRDSIGATKVRVAGKLSTNAPNTAVPLDVAALQIGVDLVKTTGKAASLIFSSTSGTLTRQLDNLPEHKSGLDVLPGLPGMVLALDPDESKIELDLIDLLRVYGYEASVWLQPLAKQIKPGLRKDSKRNCLWLFTRPYTAITRLELQLGPSSSDPSSLNAKLKGLLPGSNDSSASDFYIVTQRIVCYSPVLKTAAVRSQLTFCSNFKFPENDQAFRVRVTLEQDYVTLLVIKESQSLDFATLLHHLFAHFEKKFQESGFAKAIHDLTLFFEEILGIKLPAEGDKVEFSSATSHDIITWRDFTFTVQFADSSMAPKLVAAAITFEAKTEFGAAPKEHSIFLFRLSWSTVKGLDFRASFKPGNPVEGSKKIASFEQQLDPLWNDATLSSQSQDGVKALSLRFLHTKFGEVTSESWPSWLPTEIHVLDLEVNTSQIVFKTVFSSREFEKPSNELKGLERFLSGVEFDVYLDYNLKDRLWNLMSLRTEIRLPPLKSQEQLPDCIITAWIEMQSKIWQIRGEVEALYFASLAALLPEDACEPIIQIMGHSMLLDLQVTYRIEDDGSSNLSFNSVLFLAGLQLELTYKTESKDHWLLRATLAADSYEFPEKIGLKSFLHECLSPLSPIQDSISRGNCWTVGKRRRQLCPMMTIRLFQNIIGGNEVAGDLPRILENITFSTKDISIEFVCTQMTDDANLSYLFWGITLHIGHVSMSFFQLLAKSGNNTNHELRAKPKRMLHISLSGFHAVSNVPVAGDINLPFDTLHLYWLNSNLTASEKKMFDSEVFNTTTSTAKTQTQASGTRDVPLRQGLHFLATSSTGSTPMIDHVVNMIEKSDKPAQGDQTAQGKGAASSEPKWPSASQPETKPYRKSQGGLHISDFGLQMKDQELEIYLTAIAHLGPLEIALNGLTLNLNFSKFKLPDIKTLEPSFSLQGLGLGYSRGGITIAGELTRRPSSSEKGTEDFYGGGVVISTAKYSLTAAGAYDRVLPKGAKEPYTSLFVFGIMKGFVMKFGYVEVTGIMGGFGYNSVLHLPDVDRVQDFPFFKLARQDTSDPLQALDDLNTSKTIEPQPNSLWFAAGVNLRAFHIINIDGIVTVQLSEEEPVFGLCALATATVPPNASKDDFQFAYVAFGLVGTLDPNHGILQIQGQFLPESFLLSKNCHPTGGFAICQWFEGSPHAGEFVFSVGGYHPAFVKPEYYPTVPRVGFLWTYDDSLSISGEAYFAITSSACMAGGKLSAVYQLSWLYAHLDAYADFLMLYEPFQYDARIGVSAGVRVYVPCLICTIPISIELSAELWLHGPPMAGVAHFTFWLFSFEVTFGEARKPFPPLELVDFLQLLKQKEIDAKFGDHTLSFANCLLPNPSSVKGKEKTATQAPVETLVRGAEFHLVVQSRMAMSKIVVGTESPTQNKTPQDKSVVAGSVVGSEKRIWSKPMKLRDNLTLSSRMKITIETTTDGKRDIVSSRHRFEATAIFENVPSALWGEYYDDNDLINDLNNEKKPFTVNHLTGAHIYGPKPSISDDKLPPFTKKNFEKVDGTTGTIDPASALFASTEPHFVVSLIKKRSLDPPKDPKAQDSLDKWPEALFTDIKAWRKNPKPNILPSDVLSVFCALGSSKVLEDDPAAANPRIRTKELATDRFTYSNMAEHTDPPLKYIEQMEDWYRAPPVLHDEFKVDLPSY